MRVHLCSAEGCGVSIPLNMLMCSKHWRMVPRHMQREVWRWYRPGQETDLRSVTPEYMLARSRAVDYVAAAERMKDAR